MRPAKKGAGGAGGRQGGGQGIERLKETLQSLNLTPDQSKQVDQILDAAREQIGALAKDLKGATPEERRQKLQPILKDALEKIRGVLTEEQKKQLHEKMQARREERKNDRKTGDGKAKPGAPGAPKSAPNADVMPPATQPGSPISATNDTLAPQVPRGPMLQRVADRLAKLDLSPQQQAKTDAILDASAARIAKLRAGAVQDPDAVRDQARAIFADTRQQIAAVLSPEQQQKWQAMRDASAPPPTDVPKASHTNATPNTAAAKAAAVSSTTQLAAVAVAESTTKALYPGADAPPFRLSRLSGSPVTLDSFVNKPLVLVFGSYSAPTFRDKVAELDQLKRRYEGRAAFLIIYTREAYPAGEWEVQRNLGEQIKIEQHKSLEDRQHLAKLARDALKIQTDIAVDDIDDAVAGAYDAVPNGAYVLLNGKIVARQKWADPLGLPTWIDATMKKLKTS